MIIFQKPKMNNQAFRILLTSVIFFNPVLARPGFLRQERYEFHDPPMTATHDGSIRFSENTSLEDVQVLAQYEPILWSDQHLNEVNAFAEMFRQSYNQMIQKHNDMMPRHSLHNLLIPVTHKVIHFPDEVSWENYFGNQQQYVNYRTEQMSQKLIQDLEHGRVLQQDLMNPDFFIAHAASELDRVHPTHNEFGSSLNTYQQHQFDTFNAQQQREPFSESESYQETEVTDKVLVHYNTAGEFQYDPVLITNNMFGNGELTDAMISNANNQHSPYVEQPPVEVNSETANKLNKDVEENKMQAPASVETSRRVQKLFNEKVESTPKPLTTTNDEFYGSTYDQQPIYDLRFAEPVSSSTRPSMVNVKPLIRRKAEAKMSTTTESFATSSTTTKLATTESNIMSMLPNKKASFNYEEIYQKVRAELSRQMNQTSSNKNEETHFMGMTSNVDQEKLTYDTVTKTYEKISKDQPIEIVVVPTTSAKPTSTDLPISSSAKSFPAFQNHICTGHIDQFLTTTTKAPNPYYSAPLAPLC